MFLGSCFHWRVEAEWRRVSIHSIQTENNRHAPANQRTIAHLGWPHCSRGSQFVVCGSQQCTDHLSDYIYLPLLPLFLFQTSSSLQPSSSSGPLHQVSSSLPHGESFPTTKIFFILPPSSFRLPPSVFTHHGKFCIAFISSAMDSMVGADYPGASLMILLALLCCSSRRRCLGSHRPGEWRYRANKYPRPLRG